MDQWHFPCFRSANHHRQFGNVVMVVVTTGVCFLCEPFLNYFDNHTADVFFVLSKSRRAMRQHQANLLDPKTSYPGHGHYPPFSFKLRTNTNIKEKLKEFFFQLK